MDIKESDWKVFRRLNSVALERYCQRVLEEVKLATACNDSYHDCYLRVYRLIQDRDETMARAFNDLRRSTALMRLVNIINEGLLTDEELKQFSQELQSRIKDETVKPGKCLRERIRLSLRSPIYFVPTPMLIGTVTGPLPLSPARSRIMSSNAC